MRGVQEAIQRVKRDLQQQQEDYGRKAKERVDYMEHADLLVKKVCTSCSNLCPSQSVEIAFKLQAVPCPLSGALCAGSRHVYFRPFGIVEGLVSFVVDLLRFALSIQVGQKRTPVCPVFVPWALFPVLASSSKTSLGYWDVVLLSFSGVKKQVWVGCRQR